MEELFDELDALESVVFALLHRDVHLLVHELFGTGDLEDWNGSVADVLLVLDPLLAGELLLDFLEDLGGTLVAAADTDDNVNVTPRETEVGSEGPEDIHLHLLQCLPDGRLDVRDQLLEQVLVLATVRLHLFLEVHYLQMQLAYDLFVLQFTLEDGAFESA